MKKQYGNKVGDWPTFRLPETIDNMPRDNYTGVTLGKRWEDETFQALSSDSE